MATREHEVQLRVTGILSTCCCCFFCGNRVTQLSSASWVASDAFSLLASLLTMMH
ncbi:uncharacterized protein MYCFIDRAFT_212386, partial [Pseudocercospora fijiensis CIRAD86]